MRSRTRFENLNWRRSLEISPLRRLYERLTQKRPEIVHAWGSGALWPAALALRGDLSRLWVSAALPPGHLPSATLGWLLRHCARVLPLGQGEALACRRLGVPESRLTVLPPGIAPFTLPEPVRWPGLPDSARVVMVSGPIALHKGQLEAAWALDILAYLYPELHLVLLGKGPGEARVRSYVASTPRQQRIHFPGQVEDVRPWLARAEIVWVPCLREGGRMAALEAMAAGKPIIASQLPGLAQLIDHGRTGLLVPPRDVTGLCRLTRSLLEDPAAARRLGEAAREETRQRFDLQQLVDCYVREAGLAPSRG